MMFAICRPARLKALLADPKMTLRRSNSGLTEATGLENRGVFARPTLYVLRATRMPATLVEVGFITNASDAALMKENPRLIAEGMYNGILTYFGLN